MDVASTAAAARPSARTAVRVAAGAGLAAFSVHALVPFGGAATERFFDHWVYNALLVTAVGCCALRAVRVRRNRVAWAILAAGTALWTAGDIYWSVALAGLDEPAVPSAADAGYLLFYPAAYVGLIMLFRARARSLSRAVWIDGITAALAMASLAAAVLVEAVLRTTSGSAAVVVTNLAYPIGDMLLLALVVGVFALCQWRPGRAWLLIGAALGLMAVADGSYLFETAAGTYTEGTILDALWPAGMLLLAAAAWHNGREERVEVEHRPLLLVPAGATAIAVAIQVWDHLQHENGLAIYLSVATMLFVIARTGASFRENSRLLETWANDAVTDPVTDLGNRRRLVRDLAAVLEDDSADRPWLLVIFDLDGFKNYNDRYGHLSGDALLLRLGKKLAGLVDEPGHAYRMGGDEFCLFTPLDGADPEELSARAAETLSEVGDGFVVTSSFGSVVVPTEAGTASDALRVADRRLYAVKHGKHSERDRPHEVLLQAMLEREPNLHEHIQGVATLSLAVGRALGLSTTELRDLHRAAQLHDIGKIAIPDEVLHKPGPLDAEEMVFIRRHTLVGQRILGASPALLRVGEIVRASHERWDGTGYPDGVQGELIPLPARIVSVCDAYHAMTSDRPYRSALPEGEAIHELLHGAGSQFDPEVVRLFCDALRSHEAARGLDAA